MNIVVRIPDELAARLGDDGRDLERQALEAFVLENFRAGRMTTGDLSQALGFATLDQADKFLKAHNVFEPYTIEDIDRQLATLTKLGM